MHESYADVLESYIIDDVATEGFGEELLKLLGKGALKVAKTLGIFIGIPLVLTGFLVWKADKITKRTMERFKNPTPEEKLSKDNFMKTWLPEINKFSKMVREDIDKADKKIKIKKFLNCSRPKTDKPVLMDGTTPYYYDYNTHICSLEWSECQYENADGDDEGNPKLVKEFSEKIEQLKPYFNKWKNEAKKFSPYFDLVIDVENQDDNYYWCDFYMMLRCKWVDKDQIIKPGLPEFGKR